MELSEHVVDFEKRSTIKSQVLLDFITDWTGPSVGHAMAGVLLRSQGQQQSSFHLRASN
jgi:hypothetical protein